MAASRSSNGIGRHSQRSTLLKVVILGDGGVGKSCLMNRFVSNHFDEQSFHTIGVEFLNKDIEINGESYTLQIWDTAGQERFKTLRTPFYRGSDICLLTYAVDDPVSFKNLNLWKSEFCIMRMFQQNHLFPSLLLAIKEKYIFKNIFLTKVIFNNFINEIFVQIFLFIKDVNEFNKSAIFM
ncbi:unnamed protein product [Trichogramma brassicae]|uniref:Ras-related protein Rab-9A n=1 Tax=Trichogramma brassicae TaxID=86971 RepID=A0A6H5J0M5_9HYME|nr:unnamed protein product [Trichogramma brassicae]